MPDPPNNGFCKSYRVISTRAWRFSHTRSPRIIKDLARNSASHSDLSRRSRNHASTFCWLIIRLCLALAASGYVHYYTYKYATTKCSTWNTLYVQSYLVDGRVGRVAHPCLQSVFFFRDQNVGAPSLRLFARVGDDAADAFRFKLREGGWATLTGKYNAGLSLN